MRPHIASGPRGRRLLFEFLASSGTEGRALREAAWPSGTAEGSEIAARIAAIDREPTSESVHRALMNAVAFAMYWQEPDESDRALADPVVEAAFAGIDQQPVLAALDFGDQELAVRWTIDEAGPDEGQPAGEVLSRWLDGITRSVRRSERERPNDPRAPWSGTWYSIPPNRLLSSCGTTPTGVPAGLEYVEDGPPSDKAEVLRITITDPSVCAIDSGEDWAELCDRYPLDVTAEVRHDWYRTTGRDGPWIIPNWRDVGRDWDGVKLTVAAYLSSAGTAIPTTRAASVIAGWGPGHTYWLTDRVTITDRHLWMRNTDGMSWHQA